jgi:hypothetical protein
MDKSRPVRGSRKGVGSRFRKRLPTSFSVRPLSCRRIRRAPPAEPPSWTATTTSPPPRESSRETYSVSISYPGGPAKRTSEEVAAGASAWAQELLSAKYNSETKLQAEIKISGSEPVDFRLE